MSGSTLIEVVGDIVFSFTRAVTEHYNPEEPEYTTESFGYDPLQSTGREWYYHPVDELIYQEYSEREVTSTNYLACSSLDVRVRNACSPEEDEETDEQQEDEDKAMAWKRLRPSAPLHIVFSFTPSVTEHYNREEPEYTAESFGYDPLKCTGREWYYHPVDELIYQEYRREVTSLSYLASNSLDVRVTNACSPEENEETDEHQQYEDKAMAWKRLRPSVLQTVFKSMYIGALISLFTAIIIGTMYVILSYLHYKTVMNCQYQKDKMAVRVQWARTIADIISCSFYYICSILNAFLLFRSYQLKGVKRKLMLVCFVMYCLDSLNRGVLQAVGKPYFTLPALYNVPSYVFLVAAFCYQPYLIESISLYGQE